MKAPNNNITQNQATEGTEHLNLRSAEPGELLKDSQGNTIEPLGVNNEWRATRKKTHPNEILVKSK